MDKYSDDIGPGRANWARIHNYLLGGSLNNSLDRFVALDILAENPLAGARAQAHRSFLGCAVETMVGRGIRQFLDLGVGVPSCDPTHRIAHRWDRNIRVVYVDNEPETVDMCHTILSGTATVTAVEADLRSPAEVLYHPATRPLINLTQPLGMLAIDLWTASQDNPAALLAGYIAALPPDSLLALTVRANPGDLPDRDQGRVDTVSAWLHGLTPLRITTIAGWLRLDPPQGADAEYDIAAIAVRPQPPTRHHR